MKKPGFYFESEMVNKMYSTKMATNHVQSPLVGVSSFKWLIVIKLSILRNQLKIIINPNIIEIGIASILALFEALSSIIFGLIVDQY